MYEIDLSIVIPVYNVEAYLKECLESVYSIKNIKKEVILVNDGSTDSSLDILKFYKEKYQYCTKLITKKNGGLSDARNVGMKNSSGKYIYFIDSDDYIDNKKFEDIFFEGLKKNVDIIKASGYYLKGGQIEKLDKKEIKSNIYSGEELIKLLHKKNKYARVEVWLSIYKKEFLEKTDNYFIKGLIYEDTIFSYKCWLNSNNIMYINENFYYYRIREGSIMNNNKEKDNFKYKILNCKLLLKELQNKKTIFNEIYYYIIKINLYGIIKFKLYNEEVVDKIFYQKLSLKNRAFSIILKILSKVLLLKKINI